VLHAEFPHIASVFPALHLLERFGFPRQGFAVELFHLFDSATLAGPEVDSLAFAAGEADEL
jgi:hypothetical protein